MAIGLSHSLSRGCYAAHIVVTNMIRMPIIPNNLDAAPTNVSNRPLIGRAILPRDAVTASE
jgi:hypothetical protein